MDNILSKWQYITLALIQVKAPKEVIEASKNLAAIIAKEYPDLHTDEWLDDYDELIKRLPRMDYCLLADVVTMGDYCTPCQITGDKPCNTCFLYNYYNQPKYFDISCGEDYKIVDDWLDTKVEDQGCEIKPYNPNLRL